MRDPYFQLPGISNSALARFKRSPLHYLHHIENPEPPTPAMAFGSLVHCIVLEEKNFNQYFILLDESKRPIPDKDYRTKENAMWKARILEEARSEDKMVVTGDDYNRARIIRDKLYEYGPSKDILLATGNQFEVPMTWKYNKSICKGKRDVVNPEFLCDLKTTQDAEPFEFQRTIFKRDYHRQGGMYLDGDAKGQLNISKSKSFLIIAVETLPPYGISVHVLGKDVIEAGYLEYTLLTDQLQACIDTGVWQGYEFKSNVDSEGVFDVSLPKWMKND